MPKIDPSNLGALLAAQRMVKMTSAERIAVATAGAAARWKGHKKNRRAKQAKKA